jgi:hypothetical protein
MSELVITCLIIQVFVLGMLLGDYLREREGDC